MIKKIEVEGMSCEHCISHIKEALNELEGVSNVTVDINNKTTLLESRIEIDDEKIKSALDDAGYKAVNIKELKS